jgi:hypothetical protein
MPLDEVTILERSLSRPELPLCPMSALGMLRSLHLKMKRDSNLSSRVYDFTTRWLSLRRTPAQVHNISSATCRCSLVSFSDSGVHQLGSAIYATEGGVGWMTPGAYFVIMCGAGLIDIHRETPTRIGYKLHHLAARTSWPKYSKQVLPHGTDHTMHGYMDWLLSNNPVVLANIGKVISAVIDYTRSLSISAIIKTNMFPALFIRAISHWLEGWIKLERPCVHASNCSLLNHDQDKDEQIGEVFCQLSKVMNSICAGPDCSDPAMDVFFLQRHHQAIFISCNNLLSAAVIFRRDHPTQDIVATCDVLSNWLIPVCRTIYNYFPECRAPMSKLPLHHSIIKHALPEPVSVALSWTMLTDAIEHHRTRDQCSSPDCSRTTEERGRPFRSCSGCRRISYCSRTCQKRAWQRDGNDGLAHRDICSLVRLICIRHRIPHSRRDPAGAGQGMDQAETMPILMKDEIKMMGMINSHFAAMTAYRLRHDI